MPDAVRADLAVAADRTRLLDAAPALYGLAVFTGDPVRIADPEQAMLRSHEANYMGPVLLAREAAERMKSSGARQRTPAKKRRWFTPDGSLRRSAAARQTFG
jgi:hypothetical protein